jgi:hypothetical protein
VLALSDKDVWAVGGSGIIHWNGRGWQIYRAPVQHPPGRVGAIDGTSPNDIWAVGGQNEDASILSGLEPLALHWNGSSWRQTNALGVPFVGGLTLNGFKAVNAVSRTPVWTLSWGDDYYNAILISDGRIARIAYEDSGDAVLSDIAVRSRTDVWAVGGSPIVGASDKRTWPFVLHFNGRTWRIQHAPFDRLVGTDLAALSTSTPDEIWAAGKHLIIRRSC